MALTGRQYSAAEVYRWGLINELTKQNELLEVAKRWAEEIIACAPLSVRLHKQIMQESVEGDSFIDLVARQQKEMVKLEFASEDLHEGIKAFAEKRKPVWKNC